MKDVAWGITHGEDTIIARCDNCGKREEFDFDDGYPNFKQFQQKLFAKGWKSCQINGEWKDFCCEEHRNEYIRNNT